MGKSGYQMLREEKTHMKYNFGYTPSAVHMCKIIVGGLIYNMYEYFARGLIPSKKVLNSAPTSVPSPI